MYRNVTTAPSVTERRRTTADREAARFADFRAGYGLGEDIESLTLYLSALADDESGASIRRRLQALDLERRLRGLPPWTTDGDVRALLRGLHAEHPVGPDAPAIVGPLYIELMRALVDTTRVPTMQQRRTTAAIILRASTGLPTAALARLTWDQVRLCRTHVRVTVEQRVGRGALTEASWLLAALPGDSACPVSALLPLRGGHLVLVDTVGRWDEARLRASLAHHARESFSKSGVRSALAKAATEPPSLTRDRALLTMGYGAGLRTYEASDLLQGDAHVCDGGVMLRVAGRRAEVWIPSVKDSCYDPVSSWTEWVACMSAQGRSGPEKPAFPTCNYSSIGLTALAPQGLNRMIHLRCEQADLHGNYAWTSLRIGMMRTAIRQDAPEWAVARQADLTSLGSVHRHERRENLMRRNVAGRLGL